MLILRNLNNITLLKGIVMKLYKVNKIYAFIYHFIGVNLLFNITMAISYNEMQFVCNVILNIISLLILNKDIS